VEEGMQVRSEGGRDEGWVATTVLGSGGGVEIDRGGGRDAGTEGGREGGRENKERAILIVLIFIITTTHA